MRTPDPRSGPLMMASERFSSGIGPGPGSGQRIYVLMNGACASVGAPVGAGVGVGVGTDICCHTYLFKLCLQFSSLP